MGGSTGFRGFREFLSARNGLGWAAKWTSVSPCPARTRIRISALGSQLCDARDSRLPFIEGLSNEARVMIWWRCTEDNRV